jgi:DNA mismatch repair protein MutL
MRGFIGKPNVSRGNRNFENYFVNGRFIKSPLISKSIEDAYHSFLMLHQYPFTALTIEIDGQEVDVNVHPQKMELKFQDPETIYEEVYGALRQVLEQKELIPEVQAPAPATVKEGLKEGSSIQAEPPISKPQSRPQPLPEPFETGRKELPKITKENQLRLNLEYEEETKPKFKILGQVFRTYWIVEQEERLLLVDQHAAHEKVIFERLMQRKRQKEVYSQTLSPGFVLTLSPTEQTALADHKELFLEAGYEIEDFGGNSVEITAVPADIYGLGEKQYFLELLDELATLHKKTETDELYLRIATMSCKAAIKGNQDLSVAEFESLMEQLFACENPYQCPHGRPTMISMTRYDLERKFKRIV